MYFDLLIFNENINRLAVIFLNTLNNSDEIEIPSILSSIDYNTLNKIYSEAVNIISNQKMIHQPNQVFFTDLINKVDVLKSNVNPQRRMLVGLNDYVTTLKSINYYNNIRIIIQKYIRHYKGDVKVLDCGCGCGYGSFILGKIPNSQVIGADIDGEAVTIANLINIERKNVSYMKASLEDLNDKGYKFDYIVSLETLEHIDEPEKFIRAALNLLNDNGVLIVSIPHWRYHGTDLNSDYVINWSIEKSKKFFGKIFNKYDFFTTELVDLKNVLYSSFNFKKHDEYNYNKVENMFFICNKKDLIIDKKIDVKPKKLKILFVNHSIPPYEYTGTPIATYTEMRSLQKLGHETDVLIPNKDSSNGVIKEFINNITVYKVPPLNWAQTFLEDAYFGYNIRNYLNMVEDVVKDFNPDIVHINDYVFMSSKIIELFEAMGLPMVRFVHFMEELCFRTRPFYKDELCSGPETPLKCAKCIQKDNYNTNNIFRIRNESNYLSKINARFEYIKYLHNKYNAILFMADTWQDYMNKFINYDKAKSHIVPLSIDLSIERREFIKKTEDIVNLIYIGTVARAKGIDLLIDLFKDKEVLKKSFVLYIYGKITENDLQSKIRDLEKVSKGKVKYMGSYKKEDLPMILENVDMGILPYYIESYSIATRELLYMGIPPIVSDTYGIPDIIKDGYNGLLFKVGDLQGLKQKVMMVLENKHLIDKLKEGAINTSIPTPEDEAKQLENIYLNILSSD
jgi:glycosyltransferase involved in cell wall biosynthesis/2-polyprenyl-3-methyl-5-hydroxy-6-metoxy-1,4-benzoquinol methylase